MQFAGLHMLRHSHLSMSGMAIGNMRNRVMMLMDTRVDARSRPWMVSRMDRYRLAPS